MPPPLNFTLYINTTGTDAKRNAWQPSLYRHSKLVRITTYRIRAFPICFPHYPKKPKLTLLWRPSTYPLYPKIFHITSINRITSPSSGRGKHPPLTYSLLYRISRFPAIRCKHVYPKHYTPHHCLCNFHTFQLPNMISVPTFFWLDDFLHNFEQFAQTIQQDFWGYETLNRLFFDIF